jgi:ribonucleoside-diphosphate reductase alpha chain
MSLTNISVDKKKGIVEEFNIGKIHKVTSFACEGLQGVSPSSLEISLSKKLASVTKITTSEITKLLVKCAQELVYTDSANYQYVAGRLTNYDVRKIAYGTFEVPPLYDIVMKNVNDGWYDKEILEFYTKEEIEYFGSKIDHRRDEHFTIAAWKQLTSKYLVRDKKEAKGYGFKETPQIMYMMIAMTLMNKRHDRKTIVVELYDAISKGSNSVLSQATPIVGGVRTPTRQFSSCVVGKAGDSLESINASSNMIVNYASKRAGIGIDLSEIRPYGSPIRNGEVTHTGILPFTKLIQSATKSSSQGGIRSGASTAYFNIFHLEIEDIITLKNNRGTEENRARQIDYGININTHFYQKVVKGEDYWLFNTNQTPGLYEAFFTDPIKFEELYEKYAKKRGIQKKKVNAKELFVNLCIERMGTGRIYIHNVDNVNKQTVYNGLKDVIYSSNLCLEISLTTHNLTKLSNFTKQEALSLGIYNDAMSPNEFKEKFGEIGLCTLSNINWGMIKSPDDFEIPCKLAVYSLDELLDYQSYPVIAAEVPAKARRQLGIGVNNLAYFLAKNGVQYGSQEALELIDEYMEAMYYYCTKASLELAKEKGKCDWWDQLDYDFIFNKRNPNVDQLVEHKPRYDWDSLKKEIDVYGLRHTMLISTPPSETNSILINATNGVEPVRSLITVKGNGDDTYPVVVPNLSLKYDMLWGMDMLNYIKTVAVLQKYHDQGISNNLSYDPDAFPDGKLPIKKVMTDILMAQKYGLKSLYYHNTKGEDDVSTDCESCKL